MESTNQVARLTSKEFFAKDNVKKKFEELLGKRAPQFLTSVMQIATSNHLLANADPMSIYNSAVIAATMDLPLNNNLGFAYIVPYNDRQKGQVAQFQMGYKGFIQLAQRSGQFKTISATPIYKGQIISSDPLRGIKFDFTVEAKGDPIGYASYFELLNGFEKTLYMTVDELKAHGVKYSQTFKKGTGIWRDNFDAMAQKTVLKLLLSKFAPLSIEMQKAVIADQSVITKVEGEDIEVSYVDHQDVTDFEKASDDDVQSILDSIEKE